jgi:hypothetical protein
MMFIIITTRSTTTSTPCTSSSKVILSPQEGSKPAHPPPMAYRKIPGGLCLEVHELAKSTENHFQWHGRSWNTTNKDDFYLTIVLYGVVDEINVLRVILQGRN